MYYKDIIGIIIIGLAQYPIFLLLPDVAITESLVQNCITFLSITLGFYMTSLSVMYSSRYALRLYKEVDPEKPTQRKIHTLQSYFKNSAYCSLLSIVILILYSLFSKVENNILQLNSYFEIGLIAMLAINFVFMYLLLKVFINGLVHEHSGEQST